MLLGHLLQAHLIVYQKGINDFLVVLHLNLMSTHVVTIISTYVPMITCSDEIKEKFYKLFDKAIESAHPCKKLIILGDFNQLWY